MNLNRLSRALFLMSRTARDVNAVKRGKVGRRVGNRVIGRTVSKTMRKGWFK